MKYILVLLFLVGCKESGSFRQGSLITDGDCIFEVEKSLGNNQVIISKGACFDKNNEVRCLDTKTINSTGYIVYDRLGWSKIEYICKF